MEARNFQHLVIAFAQASDVSMSNCRYHSPAFGHSREFPENRGGGGIPEPASFSRAASAEPG